MYAHGRGRSEFCVHHASLVDEHGAEALKRGLPRRNEVVASWQPVIVAPESEAGTPAPHATVIADPATVRPRLAEAAAESLDEISRSLLEAAVGAVKKQWITFECDCGRKKRVEVPVPDVRARVAAIELLLREGLGRTPQAEESALPRIPRRPGENATGRGVGGSAHPAHSRGGRDTVMDGDATRRSNPRASSVPRIRVGPLPNGARTGVHGCRRPRVLTARSTAPAGVAASLRRDAVGADRRAGRARRSHHDRADLHSCHRGRDLGRLRGGALVRSA
jgi:hypothetical protein